jgi:hypothetical protein
MNCYICNIEISNDNQTDEHIIINAAGGRLKSKNLICLNCNSSFGEGIDRELAKQLNGMANMLMIQRQRGEPQPILANHLNSGEQYQLGLGGNPALTKPIVSQKLDGQETKIAVRARSEKELRSILKGLSKKYPQLDVEVAMGHAKWRREYFDDEVEVNLEVGGVDVFRAVCKCATNFFVFNGGEASEIRHLIPFIRGAEERNVVWMHYHNLYDITPDECFHLIHLVGNVKEQVLYCYVDYFNTHRFLVLLSDGYTGPEIKQTYCFDVVNAKQFEKTILIDYDRQTLLNFFINRDVFFSEKVNAAFQRTLNLGLRRQDKFQRTKILDTAVRETLEKFTEPTLTEPMINEVIDEIAKKMAMYILRLPKRKG